MKAIITTFLERAFDLVYYSVIILAAEILLVTAFKSFIGE